MMGADSAGSHTHTHTHTPRSVNRVQCSLSQRLSAATRGAHAGGQPLCGQAAILTAPPALEPFSEERHYLEVLAVHVFEVSHASSP